MSSESLWSSDFKTNLAMLSYSTGITIPKIASPWFLKSKIGVLLLIPVQVIVIFLITFPSMFMEVALGQYSNRGVLNVWAMCPIFKGVGIASFTAFLFYQIYYQYICTCTICFTFWCLIGQDEWKSCDNSWNTVNCFTLKDNFTRRLQCQQNKSKEECDGMKWQSSLEQFYFYKILNVDTSGLVGVPQFELLIFAIFTTCVIFIANFNGPRSIEKILVALAVGPTLQLVVLFFIPLLKSNVYQTLKHLFSDFDKTELFQIKTWISLTEFSLSLPGLGFGVYTTTSAHFSFRSPFHLKAIVFSLVPSLFTVLYCITLQLYLVSLCLESKMLLENFFRLPNELEMPDSVFFLQKSSKVWMVMWLSNSYLLGLRSLIVMMSINAEAIYTSLPKLRKHHNFFILFFCVCVYGLHTFFTTKVGYLVMQSVEKVFSKIVIVFLNFSNLFAVIFFYGVRNFKDDVHFMLGIRFSKILTSLYILNPILLGSVLVYNFYDFYTTIAGKLFWIQIFEQVLANLFPSIVVLFFCFHVFRKVLKGNFQIFRAEKGWGPRFSILAKSREMFRIYPMAKEHLYRQNRFKQKLSDESQV